MSTAELGFSGAAAMEELLRRRISFFSDFEDGSLVFSCEAFVPHRFPVDDCVAILSDEDRVRFIFFFSSAKGRKSLLPLRVLLSRSPTSSAVPGPLPRWAARDDRRSAPKGHALRLIKVCLLGFMDGGFHLLAGARLPLLRPSEDGRRAV